jgi:menaquinone-dependent protoporphyrinogen oxidase
MLTASEVTMDRQPRVLIAYATRAGGTRGVARAIQQELRWAGALVDLEPVELAGDPAAYDAVILGSAVYFGSWERDAIHYAESHSRELRRIPVWLFSSGPLDWSDPAAPVDPPRHMDDLIIAVHARGHHVFGGVLDPATAGIVGRRMADEGLAGDFRDLPAVRQWARGIAAELMPAQEQAGSRS